MIPHGCLGSFIEVGSVYGDGTGAIEYIFVGPTTDAHVRMIAAESNTNPVGMLFC